jgi:hypothetical protein
MSRLQPRAEDGSKASLDLEKVSSFGRGGEKSGPA